MLVAFLLAGSAIALSAQDSHMIMGPPPGTGGPGQSSAGAGFLGAMKESALKAALIAATARSIGMDIAALTSRLAASSAGGDEASGLERKIADLEDELARTVILRPADYAMPEKKKIAFKPKKDLGFGSVLNADFIVAGMQGDDFSLLEAGKQYSVDAYVLRVDASSKKDEAGRYVFLMAPASAGPGFSVPDQGAPPAKQ